MNELNPVWALLLCVVGLLLSYQYKGEKYRTVLLVFRILSIFMATVAALSAFFAGRPDWTTIVLGLIAIGVNLPLAAIGLKKSEK